MKDNTQKTETPTNQEPSESIEIIELDEVELGIAVGGYILINIREGCLHPMA